ncbi:MAG TPA: GntR family transcriptional regulator [Urbifossiella sp.]|nr:GntR family transcriptional regulator [Urbifossiella sp.]
MPVLRDTVRDQVRRALTERILSGHYPPGERLVELRIARELGTSQGSVREALRDLEASRLVESEPRRGTRVRVISHREMRQAYFVRGVLEEAAAPAATTALGGDVADLRAEVAGLLRAHVAGDLTTQAAHVYAFHRKLVEASGNCVLLRMWESLALETRVRIRLGWGEVDPAQVESSYEAVMGALGRGDGPGAGRLLRAHAEAFAPPDEPAGEG